MQQQASCTPEVLTETSVNVYSLAAQRSFHEEPSEAAPYDKKSHDFLDDPNPDKKFEDNQNGQAAVKSYDPKAGRPLAESHHVALKTS